MSRMRNNTWVFFSPIVIIMKIECTVPGETSLLEFALFVKFVASHERRQIYLYDFFFIIFRRTISSRSGSHKLRNTLFIYKSSRPSVRDLNFLTRKNPARRHK